MHYNPSCHDMVLLDMTQLRTIIWRDYLSDIFDPPVEIIIQGIRGGGGVVEEHTGETCTFQAK